jgi:hypothetical protein
MSKPSRRADREQIKAKRKQYKEAQRKLRQDDKAKGLKAPSHATISNHKCAYSSVEEERFARNETVGAGEDFSCQVARTAQSAVQDRGSEKP